MPAASDGPSPRVRGTRGQQQRALRRVRSIPACAGNTLKPYAAVTTPSVHPRVCGEHYLNGCEVRKAYGPSPRVRGTRRSAARDAAPDRSIPACAGNTRRPWRPCPCPPVHPRVCGEHSWWKVLRRIDLSGHGERTNDSGEAQVAGHRTPLGSRSSGTGRNLTSFSPSISNGARRSSPHVSKSYPPSCGVAPILLL